MRGREYAVLVGHRIGRLATEKPTICRVDGSWFTPARLGFAVEQQRWPANRCAIAKFNPEADDARVFVQGDRVGIAVVDI